MQKTFTRKIYEMMLAFKLERNLSKDQILEIYMNQIFLGNRAYGFAAASEAYFGKLALQQINLAEAAMLAGLPSRRLALQPDRETEPGPRAPALHPEPHRQTGFITQQQADEAEDTELVLQRATYGDNVHAEYVAGEMVRQLIYDQYGADTYTRGLNIYTTISTEEQHAAYKAVRTGILNYDTPAATAAPSTSSPCRPIRTCWRETMSDALIEYPDAGEMKAAVVTEASPRKVIIAQRQRSHQHHRQRPALGQLLAVEQGQRQAEDRPRRHRARGREQGQLDHPPTA